MHFQQHAWIEALVVLVNIIKCESKCLIDDVESMGLLPSNDVKCIAERQLDFGVPLPWHTGYHKHLHVGVTWWWSRRLRSIWILVIIAKGALCIGTLEQGIDL